MKYPNLTKFECAEWDRLSMKMGMENIAQQAAAFQFIKEIFNTEGLEPSEVLEKSVEVICSVGSRWKWGGA